MQRYNATSHLYDLRYAEEQEAKYKAAFEKIELTHNDLILDVGCGTGLLFRHVASEAEWVVGLDISKNLLLRAEERAKKLLNVHLVQADADNLPFVDNLFKEVFIFTLLQNMPKPVETLREATRIAKHDASIIATGLKKAFSKEAFLDSLNQAGLKCISMKDDDALKCYVASALKKRT
jgi:ubiquinone/menaquinone biosynthesis C-methylase UbiE